jgi:hypothetical protein
MAMKRAKWLLATGLITISVILTGCGTTTTGCSKHY